MPETVLFAVLALLGTAFFAVLHSALLHSVPTRVLAATPSERQRERLRPLLLDAEKLATSAKVFELVCQLVFLVFVLAALRDIEPLWKSVALSLAVAVPLLAFAGELFPSAVRGETSDTLLRGALPVFVWVQKPLAALSYVLEATRRATMRALRIPEKPAGARRVVEGLRDMIEEADLDGDLDATERELIENVVEFHDVDVAEVMTPRTELAAADLEDGIAGVMRFIAQTGHTRVPVYEGSLDTIIGVVYAQEIVSAVSENTLESTQLSALVRPIAFVPETKRVSELLTEFRSDKQKMAVVLDEYGGTSGLVTMGDIVEEIVGEMRSELGEASPEAVRVREDGSADVLASTRISDVNELLELDLPEEEDYETLAGFVLSELGRFPKPEESFVHGGVEYVVTEANDRRVLAVHVRRIARQEAS